MRQQIAAVAALVGACTLVSGCTDIVDGKALAGEKAGLVNQTPISVSALDNLLLDPSQINSALGATSMKVWFSAKSMWDWSKSVTDTNCLAVDGAAQDKVYAGTGWTAMRGQRLDDSIDDSKNRKHYTIQAVVAFPNFKVTATTLRTVKTATLNDWGAICWAGGRFYEAPHRSGLEILDRVGGGDSFASGLVYGLMTSDDPQKAVEYGAAHGALAMTTPGDTSMASLKEVEKLMAGGSARVQR